MRLSAFRISNFRSVEDSGWIESEDITTLIGTNESGKTNLLVPLWKLNPAKEGEIHPIADYPRSRYNEIRNAEKKPVFVRARFELSAEEADHVAEIANTTPANVRSAKVSRRLDGKYMVSFPEAEVIRSHSAGAIEQILTKATGDIEELEARSTQEALRKRMLSALKSARDLLPAGSMGEAVEQKPTDGGTRESVAPKNTKDPDKSDASGRSTVDRKLLRKIVREIDSVKTGNAPQKSRIAPRYQEVVQELKDMQSLIGLPHPNKVGEARSYVRDHMPSFVYYSNYGNLDSEIYLPHVIEDMKREGLGPKKEARSRTLKVLFEFVGLEPAEIQELGKEIHPAPRYRQGQPRKPTEEQIEQTRERKREREILLQSASTKLTREFRRWWKQGDYVFRFQADGDHFRIWVKDDRRPEEVELEGRSAGLQWFLSFYLVFLVESQDSHAGAILLLDEPGLSLHPIAQEDLSRFFENLAETNQIVYTTHSPFMVDADHLDRVRAVYVDDDGRTAVSPDLRAPEKNEGRQQSIYPVHAALGMSASQALLLGSLPVIVEGASDQIYLSAIKSYLTSKGLIQPREEIVFLPSSGVKGVRAMAGILSEPDQGPPFVLLDSDSSGNGMAMKLKSGGIYAGQPERVLQVGDFVDVDNAEVEDLWPTEFLATAASRHFRGPISDFSDVVEKNKPIVPQMESFGRENDIDMSLGWKVRLAKLVKRRLASSSSGVRKENKMVDTWVDLFNQFARQ